MVCVLLPGSSIAHGAVHDQIAFVSSLLANNPLAAELYIKRGELYREDRAWQAAIDDFKRAAELAPEDGRADFHLGRALLEQGKPRDAIEALERALAKNPARTGAYIVRARAKVAEGDYLAAAEDYNLVITRLEHPRPELFLERARAYKAAGTPYFTTALEGLNEGIAMLGDLPVLGIEIIAIATAAGRFDAALKQIEIEMKQTRRKERWLVKQGEILAAADEPERAHRSFAAALAAIASLPPARRNTAAMRELRRRIHSDIGRLRGAADEEPFSHSASP